VVEATTLNSMQSRSYSVSSSPYKMSLKSTKRFKSYYGFLCTHLRRLNARHFRMAEATRLKCGVQVIFNCITCLQNCMKIHQSVQKLFVGDTHRQAGDLLSVLSFLESRLQMTMKHHPSHNFICMLSHLAREKLLFDCIVHVSKHSRPTDIHTQQWWLPLAKILHTGNKKSCHIPFQFIRRVAYSAWEKDEVQNWGQITAREEPEHETHMYS
jgi:hypothetical protein